MVTLEIKHQEYITVKHSGDIQINVKQKAWHHEDYIDMRFTHKIRDQIKAKEADERKAIPFYLES